VVAPVLDAALGAVTDEVLEECERLVRGRVRLRARARVRVRVSVRL
jgi:hypothetical protein